MSYNFYINDFEGPLDLLLHLVKQSKMDIYEISIKVIIDEYISFLKSMEELNIDIASEYLVMASELIHLKSRMLINKDDDEKDEEFEINTEDDLRKKILEYEVIKNITSSFKELEEKRGEVYTKLPESLKEYYEEQEIPKGIFNVEDLYNALIEFQKRYKLSKPLNTKITKKEISVEERTKEIRSILKEKGKVDFLSLFDIPTKEYIIVTFLTILDMSKNHEINITQENNFSPITIEGVTR